MQIEFYIHFNARLEYCFPHDSTKCFVLSAIKVNIPHNTHYYTIKGWLVAKDINIL